MRFIETSLFTRLLPDHLPDDEYAEMQWYLLHHPESGALIPGSGGVRKLRWQGSGRGKRGGLRVIYYYRKSESEIWLLTLYPKNVTSNIPGHVLKAMKREIET